MVIPTFCPLNCTPSCAQIIHSVRCILLLLLHFWSLRGGSNKRNHFFKCYFSQDPREEVIQAWYMDDSNEDQRLPHHKEPKEFVSLDQLAGKLLAACVGYNYVQIVGLTLTSDLWLMLTSQNLESLVGD